MKKLSIFIAAIVLVLISAQTVSAEEQLYRNLSIGDSGNDVQLLQQFLNSDDQTSITASGPGSAGNETTYFGEATKDAVIRFQNLFSNEILEPAELTSGTGYVGLLTRGLINQYLSKTTTPDGELSFGFDNFYDPVKQQLDAASDVISGSGGGGQTREGLVRDWINNNPDADLRDIRNWSKNNPGFSTSEIKEYAEGGQSDSSGSIYYGNTESVSASIVKNPIPNSDVNIVSAVGDLGVGNGNAVASYVHPSWTKQFTGATWIWDNYLVTDASKTESKTFKKTFDIVEVLAINSAKLWFAADDSYVIKVNGTIINSSAGFNVAHGPVDVIDDLKNGLNTIEIKVTNVGQVNTNGISNPSGGIYKLVIDLDENYFSDIDVKVDSGVDNEILSENETEIVMEFEVDAKNTKVELDNMYVSIKSDEIGDIKDYIDEISIYDEYNDRLDRQNGKDYYEKDGDLWTYEFDINSYDIDDEVVGFEVRIKSEKDFPKNGSVDAEMSVIDIQSDSTPASYFKNVPTDSIMFTFDNGTTPDTDLTSDEKIDVIKSILGSDDEDLIIVIELLLSWGVI